MARIYSLLKGVQVMQESINLVQSGISAGHVIQTHLDHQLQQEMESLSLLADSSHDLHETKRVLDSMSWAGWVMSAVSWRSDQNRYDLSPLSPLDGPQSDFEEEGQQEEEDEEGVLIGKVSVLNTLSRRISRKLKRSVNLIDDISTLSSSVEEDLIVVQARAGRLSRESVKLVKVGVFRLALAETQEYIAVDTNQKLNLSSSKSSSNEWIYYQEGDPGRGGLLHVRTQCWLGMDLWGNPSVSAKQWSAWEELSLSHWEKGKSTGIFFLARHVGRGEWLSVSEPTASDIGDRRLAIQSGRERANINMEEI